MLAHHSFAAEYDSAKPISLTGTVTKVEWMNPHARFYIDVKDEKGEVANWELELGSPNGLMRQGWTRNSLKQGDVVSVSGSLAKDGSKLANARSVTLADGKKVFAGSSETKARTSSSFVRAHLLQPQAGKAAATWPPLSLQNDSPDRGGIDLIHSQGGYNMKVWSRVTLALSAAALLSLSGVRLSGQAPAKGNGPSG